MIKYPLICITNGSKMSWLNRALKLLHEEHNIMGAWSDSGIMLTRYEKLRNKVQVAFPYYDGKLSESDWKKYKDDRFMKKFNEIGKAMGELKEASMLSTTYSPNLDDDIIIEE